MRNPADHYRAEAQRCLELADTAPNGLVARRWRRLADEYIGLAEQIDVRMPQLSIPARWQPQAAQQQHARAKRH